MENEKVCLVYGGDSSEREISIISGRAYFNALNRLNYDVLEIDFNGNLDELCNKITAFSPKCIVNGLHGGSGENGNIQSVFNLLKIPYTHSGVVASSIAMDKYMFGMLCKGCGLPVPENMLVSKQKLNEILMDFPYVIKPVDGGSSVGVYIIFNENDIKNIEWSYGEHAIVQKYIPGRELTVGLVGNKSLAVTEIITASGFYDYKNKYVSKNTRHVLPANINVGIADKLMKYAELVYSTVGCRGAARVDFRYDEEHNEIYILEINTQPGMTEVSLLPEQAQKQGMSFDSLVKWMVEHSCYDGQ